LVPFDVEGGEDLAHVCGADYVRLHCAEDYVAKVEQVVRKDRPRK